MNVCLRHPEGVTLEAWGLHVSRDGKAMISIKRHWRLAMAISVLSATPAAAQWTQQSFDLESGWNSVFLEVDPAPAGADQLFNGQPFAAVWTRARQSLVDGPPDCADPDDPDCAPTAGGGWWVWLPATHTGHLAMNLRVIRGGRVYLIQATEPTTWTVTGRPNGSKMRWREGFNHAGLHVVEDVNSTPTFADYLASSSAHNSSVVYETMPDGSPSKIADPGTTRIAPGRGYWITSSREVEYDGPVSIDNGSLRGIDFAVALTEHTVEVANLAAAPGNITLTYQASAGVPSDPPELPALAGDVPLKWFDFSAANPDNAFAWNPLSSESWPIDGAGSPGARRSIRLSVDRAGLSGAVVDVGGSGSQYQGLLTVTDGSGFRRLLSVVSQVSPGVTGSTASGGGGTARPGLYFGSVTVDRVAWITAGARIWTNEDPVDPELIPNPDGDNTSLRPTPATFTFPVIIHLADAGVYKMLREVTLLFDPGGGKQETPAGYVLATPECPQEVCDALVAGSLQDGQPFARRMSTAAFSFAGDLTLTGDFGSTLSGQTVLAPDDPLNPFHHLYHPDHDCDQAGQCYEIARTFALNFDTEAPPDMLQPGWGDTLLTGTYAEAIQGLHRDAIQVAGRFKIERVSIIGTLNAQ